MELENYEDGVVLHLAIAEKAAVPINGIIAIIGEKGEAFEHLLTTSYSETDKSVQVPEEPEAESSTAAAIDTSAIPATIIRMPK